MSRLAELIEELCPDGVEYKPLSECVVLPSIPSGLKRNQYENSGSYPIVDQGRGKIAGFTCDETKLVRDVPGIVFGDHTREIKYVDYFFVPGADGVKWIRAVDGISIRYLFHCLTSLSIPSRGYNRHWILVREMLIPVPPLEVQREIVRILDQFTTLEAELEAELEARRTQYEHYRNALLSWELFKGSGVDLMVRPLGELGEFHGGLSGKSKADFVVDSDACAFVTYKEVYAQSEINALPEGRVNVSGDEKQLVLKYGDVLFTGSSENLDEVGLTAVITTEFSEPVYLNSFSLCFRWFAEFVDPGYAKYMFNAPDVRREIQRCANGVTRFNLSKRRMDKVCIPIPPLDIQREITQVLDRFDALVNDISSGLPAEIAARRAQYEHYRDRLLSFPEKAASGDDAP